MEHHSNDLPWRRRATVVRARGDPDGRLDEDDVDRLLADLRRARRARHRQRRLERHRLRPAHPSSGAEGARAWARGSSSMPRNWRRIGGSTSSQTTIPSTSTSSSSPPTRCTRRSAPARSLAGATCSSHGAPEYQGGGTVEIVTPDEVHWAGLPDREEAGSPNVVGAMAMAAAARDTDGRRHGDASSGTKPLLTAVRARTAAIGARSGHLRRDAIRAGAATGSASYLSTSTAMHHALVAAILGYEGGIGVRNGCFCAQPYVVRLLGVSSRGPARLGAARL